MNMTEICEQDPKNSQWRTLTLEHDQKNIIYLDNDKQNRSTVAQMAERAPRDLKVPSLNPALDPMRHFLNITRFDGSIGHITSWHVGAFIKFFSVAKILKTPKKFNFLPSLEQISGYRLRLTKPLYETSFSSLLIFSFPLLHTSMVGLPKVE